MQYSDEVINHTHDRMCDELDYLTNEYRRSKTIEGINANISHLPENEKELVSDGYHTFKELYAHRVKLFVALCSEISRHNDTYNNSYNESGYTIESSESKIKSEQYHWKSLKHADGTMYEGWFIAGIWTEKGKTLTYHLPIEEWHNIYAVERVNAPEWDGHTSDDVIRLLSKL